MFHLYGFILGLATITGLLLVEYRFNQLNLFSQKNKSEQFFWYMAAMVIFFGIIGARAWHVATDWPLYQASPFDIFKVWKGGLSILGAITGGVAGVLIFTRFKNYELRIKNFSSWLLLDIAVFGLPFAQAIGRLGNYVNQELYGLPTSLPWAVTISRQAAISGQKYHPLWAYEAILMLIFGITLWLIDKKKLYSFTALELELGSGRVFTAYLFYYSFIRFWLDFLRIDKAMSPFLSLGINQVVLLGVMGIIIGTVIQSKKQKAESRKQKAESKK